MYVVRGLRKSGLAEVFEDGYIRVKSEAVEPDRSNLAATRERRIALGQLPSTGVETSVSTVRADSQLLTVFRHGGNSVFQHGALLLDSRVVLKWQAILQSKSVLFENAPVDDNPWHGNFVVDYSGVPETDGKRIREICRSAAAIIAEMFSGSCRVVGLERLRSVGSADLDPVVECD